MTNQLPVYIACPYTQGDMCVNVKNAHAMWEALFQEGFAPFNPLLTHYQALFQQHEYHEWLDYDMVWLKKCDAVLRLPGPSVGAEREVEVAMELGIPVFETIPALKAWRMALE